ncbi:MAG: bacterial transcriptional activator domain-containing protein, partial [Acidimicrobiales bacterium]
DLFEAAVRTAEMVTAADSPAHDFVLTLSRALDLVQGVPLTAPGTRYWSWVEQQSDVAVRLEGAIADTAFGLAEQLKSLGDLEGAQHACQRGLLACPLDENLIAELAGLHVDQGRVGSARRLVDDWEAKVRRLECGEPSDRPRMRLGEPAARL